MSIYSRILLAVDLGADSLVVGRRGQAIAAAAGAQLHLLHVVEFVPVEPVNDSVLPPVQMVEELMAVARQRLKTLATQLDVPTDHCSVEIGSVKGEIIRAARERQCDLIILGAHERHGLSIFVNFTEDTVLHAAPCDVLAVRVRNGQEPSR